MDHSYCKHKFSCAKAMAALALYCIKNYRTTYLMHCPKHNRKAAFDRFNNGALCAYLVTKTGTRISKQVRKLFEIQWIKYWLNKLFNTAASWALKLHISSQNTDDGNRQWLTLLTKISPQQTTRRWRCSAYAAAESVNLYLPPAFWLPATPQGDTNLSTGYLPRRDLHIACHKVNCHMLPLSH